MKKGFTMIELIFVIVILGVLASVAIPRLAATRDDAEVAKAATNIVTAVTDIAAYYTAQGEFNTDLTKMTNALETSNNAKVVKAGKEICATFTTNDKKITITKGTTSPCDAVWKMPGLKNMCSDTTTAGNGAAATTCDIAVGGSSINFGTSSSPVTTGGNSGGNAGGN